MSDGFAHSVPDRRVRRAWAALMTLSLALVASVAFFQHRHRANEVAYRTAQNVAIIKHHDALARFEGEKRRNPQLLFIPDPQNRGILRPRHRDELAQSLFAGRTPPATMPGTPPTAVRWVDTRRGLQFHFEFRPDGTWSDMKFGGLSFPAPPPPRPWLLRVILALQPYRKMWVGSFTPFAVGPILWIALFVASFLVKRHARPLAHAHLAVAWLCFLGWLLNPYYSVTRQGILHNDMLFWGTLMLLASAIGFWIVAARGRAVDPRLCRACRYDLTGNVSGVCPECGRAVAGGDGSQPASA